MNELTPTVSRSMGEAARASARLVESCVDHAVTELQAAELQSQRSDQRRELAAAWRELLQHRPRWSSRFPQLLKTAFDVAASEQPTEVAPIATLRPSSLTLVDDTEISQGIESSRLSQELQALLERPLAELDALMSSALGLPSVQPERNPLRPEVYARTLRKLVGEQPTEEGFPGLWLRYMTKPLAHGLEQVYRDQSHLLTLARVQAASYRLRTTPSGPTPLQPANGNGFAGSGGGGFSRSGPGSGFAGLGADSGGSGFTPIAGRSGAAPLADPAGPVAIRPEAGPHMREFMLRGLPQAQASQALDTSYYAAIEAEIAALHASEESAPYDVAAARQHMHVPPVDRPARAIGTASALPQQTWGALAGARERALVRSQLKKEARELGQAFALEVVRKLVDEVAQDPRLLAPVREAIVGLEPSLLRMSLAAPRFFSDEAHPARQLLEGVAERSLHFNDEYSVEFQAFLQPVQQAFQKLNAIESFDGDQAFRQAAGTLEAGWAAQDELDAEGERKVLDKVQAAERRQREADRIASEFAQRPDLEKVHEVVRDFILHRWTLVVAHARLAPDAQGIDPGGYIAVVSDLLWSVDSARTLHEPARAFALIPRVLLKLREGLVSVGEPPEQSAAFFRTLERLHRPVLKLRAQQRHRELPPAVPEEPAASDSSTPPESEQLWMAQAELKAAGFVDAPPSAPTPLEAVPGQDGEGEVLTEQEADTVVATLAVGTKVDLYSRQQWRRARLVWTSENGAFYMFTSHGGQPHSMTRRNLSRLLRERLMRPVAGHAVVPHALEALLQQQPLPSGHGELRS